jgi:SynChlorMet cassette radical SAM/SPASM protein ScmE
MWELQQKYPGRINAAAGPLYEANDWLKIIQARQEGQKPAPRRGHLASCGGVFSRLGARSDGIIVPCLQLAHLELGRINRDDVAELWRHHPHLLRLRERVNIPLSDFTFCQGCEYLPYCSGNCPALAYTRTGQEDQPTPDGCLRHFLEQGGRLPDVRP